MISKDNKFSYWIILLIYNLIIISSATNEGDYLKLMKLNYPFDKMNDSDVSSMNKMEKIIIEIESYRPSLSTDAFTFRSNTRLESRGRFSFISDALSRIIRTVGFDNFSKSIRDGISSGLTCMACHGITVLLVNQWVSKESLVYSVNQVCTQLRLTSPEVCSGIVESFKDQLDYIRKNSVLSAREMCGILMGYKCAVVKSLNLAWTIDIPPKKGQNTTKVSEYHKIFQSLSYLNEEQKNKTLHKVVQVTDIHYDPNYFPGTESECGEPLCCRAENKLEVKEKSLNYSFPSAGQWGSYGLCDIPMVTLEDGLKYISSHHNDSAFWLWTGDAIAHNIWSVSREANINDMRIITQLLKKYAYGKLIVPVIGNHETAPVNSFPPPKLTNEHSISWLYNEFAEQWADMIPQTAIETFKTGGYYTLPIRPGFRLIIVNTNYCARLNMWSLFDPKDPADHLQWLINELLIAESVNDKVHIIGHIPPDSRECTQAWLYNFIRIVMRFENTIETQIYGHTHADEFRVIYSLEDDITPVGYEFLGPSMTTYREFNPSFRIYKIDDYGTLIDSQSFFVNLTYANEVTEKFKIRQQYLDLVNDEPINETINKSIIKPVDSLQWNLEYSTVETYSMNNLTHHSWDSLIQKLMSDELMFNTFYYNYYHRCDPKFSDVCDAKCKSVIIDDLIVKNPFKETPKSIFSG